ncbi:MAG TPA: sulfatase [Bacteroides mediterraneensis]|uniref:sulfatase n=1 Tax=Bacteroides mediterraneensis TaxID=1841856 RepID=UPI002610B5DE|nr:sulfatase [Bacteroides mediterraneensis]HJH65812.1 sulfatase [Bacteroides mediterraneensis]
MKTPYFLCCGLAFTGLIPLHAQSHQLPNIVLINIDDLGWTDLSSNGSKYYETPHIDQLKKQGIWFQKAYAGASNSAPSRACMLTGMNTPRHGIYTVGNPDRGKKELRKLISYPNREELPEGIQILPQVLKRAGYQTFHVGKWHVTQDPCDCGIDVNIAGNHAGNPSTYFAPYQNKNLSDGPQGEFLTDRLGNEAARLIQKVNKSQPFFLYYATYAVHTPLQAPEELIEKYRRKQPTTAHSNPVYAALVEVMDRNVGKVLRAISESGQADNTIIIFTTDNGGVYDISKQWPLRAGKGSFYEGGIRVPLIIYQPHRFEHKKITETAVSQMDLFPTIMEWTGISDSLQFDGKSLMPLLESENDSAFKERPLYWHFPAYLEGGNVETVDMDFRTRPVSVILKDDWKLIENYEDGRIELYHLKTDLGEKQDVSQNCPQKVKELKTLLDNWKKRTNAPCHFKKNPYYQPSQGRQGEL